MFHFTFGDFFATFHRTNVVRLTVIERPSHSGITVTSGTEEMLYIIAGPEARKVAARLLDLPSFG
jgi:glycine cleavage system aminomethyltransferase T